MRYLEQLGYGMMFVMAVLMWAWMIFVFLVGCFGGYVDA